MRLACGGGGLSRPPVGGCFGQQRSFFPLAAARRALNIYSCRSQSSSKVQLRQLLGAAG